MLSGRRISSSSSEWMYIPWRESSLKIIARFATFKVDDLIFIGSFRPFWFLHSSPSSNGLTTGQESRHLLTAVNQSKIFKVGKLRNNLTFFDFSEKCENLKKNQEISEFDFFTISSNMKKKTQDSSATFLRFTAHQENPKNLELFCVFWWFQKMKSWILGFCVFWTQNFAKK